MALPSFSVMIVDFEQLVAVTRLAKAKYVEHCGFSPILSETAKLHDANLLPQIPWESVTITRCLHLSPVAL